MNEIFVDIKEGIPPLINDIKLVPKIIENEIDILCENNIIIKNQSSLGAEDFTYFLEKTRGVFFNLGYSNKKLNSPILHLLLIYMKIDLILGVMIQLKNIFIFQ